MGIKFHDGTNKLYRAYTNGKAWTDSTLLMTRPDWMKAWNTEALFEEILGHHFTKV